MIKPLLRLFSLLQLTKEQPLTGYIIGGLKRHEIPSLADHHYTAALMGWFLVQEIKDAGGVIDERRVVLMLLIHDLPELFGGDISTPLNRKYPDLRAYKNKIGERAMQLLSDIIGGSSKKQLEQLWDELDQGKTDAAIVVKIIDQMDHQFFLEHYNYTKKNDTQAIYFRSSVVHNHVYALTARIKNEKTKDVVDAFLKEFHTTYFNQGYQGMKILME